MPSECRPDDRSRVIIILIPRLLAVFLMF